MSKIRAVIIEDEIPAARLLRNMLESLRPDWEIEVIPGSIEESAAWFGSHPYPDILFLDIQLSDGNSFVFLEQVKPQSVIVFTTAFDEYAVRAFTVNSIDYLLKPIHKERLAETVAKFEQLTQRNQPQNNLSAQVVEVLRTITSPDKKFRTRFLISGIDRFVSLQVDDVAYFYSENRVTFAVTNQGREHVIDLSLDKLGEQLNPDRFFRTNRQTIVSISAIKEVEPYFQNKVSVHVIPPFKEIILVSKEKITQFKIWLNY